MNLYNRETIELRIEFWEMIKTALKDNPEFSDLISMTEKKHQASKQNQQIEKEINDLQNN